MTHRPILVREGGLLTLQCDDPETATMFGAALSDTLAAVSIGDGVTIEVRGPNVTMGGDLITAEAALRVALDSDPDLPDPREV